MLNRVRLLTQVSASVGSKRVKCSFSKYVAIVAIILFSLDLNETHNFRFDKLIVCYILKQCKFYASEQ